MNNILLLKNNFDIIGLKTSTEDEGASFDNIVDIVTINKVHGFRSTLKIGGCEAKSDIVTAQKLKIEKYHILLNHYQLKKIILKVFLIDIFAKELIISST